VVLRCIRPLHSYTNGVKSCAQTAHNTTQGVQDPAYEVLGLGLAPKVHHLEHPATAASVLIELLYV